MTNITNINARTGDKLVADALEKLSEFAATLGLAVEQEGRWKYDRSGQYLVLTTRFTVGGEEGVEKKQAEDFERWAKYYGLEPGDYGAVLTLRGKKYRLIKINTRRGVRYPYECESLDGGNDIRLPREYATIIAAQRKK